MTARRTTSPTVSFTIRLSQEERAALEQAAAGTPLSIYVRHKLFGGDLTPRRTRGRFPVKDHHDLAQVLGALGQTHLFKHLGEIAAAARIGALPLTPELEEELAGACQLVSEIRVHLMKALGMGQPVESEKLNLSRTFDLERLATKRRVATGAASATYG